MSKTKELRILIDKIKLQTKVELDRIVHWEVTDWSEDKEKYIKRIISEELFHEYSKENK
tara:strand:- start:1605 stop:1781 length:177 start_codon:yes stop_codon:yes gene_type:complete